VGVDRQDDHSNLKAHPKKRKEILDEVNGEISGVDLGVCRTR
jgi:hypothetical protein